MARKRGLGRGLDALLQVEATGPQTLPLERLKPSRVQPRTRFDGEDLEELTESIRSQGVVQPIVISPRPDGDYDIVAGERRWRAARRAGLTEVPVVVREIADDRQRLEMALVENLQRTDLNPIEEAAAYRTLHEGFGQSHEEIARRVGKARATVTNALRLLRLPEEVQELLRAGRLTAGQARPLVGLRDEEAQLRWARRAADGGLTAREVERRVRPSGAGRRKTAAPPDPDTAAAADRLTRRLQAKVVIRRHGRGGTVRIAFHTEEELMRLYDLLMQAGGRR